MPSRSLGTQRVRSPSPRSRQHALLRFPSETPREPASCREAGPSLRGGRRDVSWPPGRLGATFPRAAKLRGHLLGALSGTPVAATGGVKPGALTGFPGVGWPSGGSREALRDIVLAGVLGPQADRQREAADEGGGCGDRAPWGLVLTPATPVTRVSPCSGSGTFSLCRLWGQASEVHLGGMRAGLDRRTQRDYQIRARRRAAAVCDGATRCACSAHGPERGGGLTES